MGSEDAFWMRVNYRSCINLYSDNTVKDFKFAVDSNRLKDGDWYISLTDVDYSFPNFTNYIQQTIYFWCSSIEPAYFFGRRYGILNSDSFKKPNASGPYATFRSSFGANVLEQPLLIDDDRECIHIKIIDEYGDIVGYNFLSLHMTFLFRRHPPTSPRP